MLLDRFLHILCRNHKLFICFYFGRFCGGFRFRCNILFLIHLCQRKVCLSHLLFGYFFLPTGLYYLCLSRFSLFQCFFGLFFRILGRCFSRYFQIIRRFRVLLRRFRVLLCRCCFFLSICFLITRRNRPHACDRRQNQRSRQNRPADRRPPSNLTIHPSQLDIRLFQFSFRLMPCRCQNLIRFLLRSILRLLTHSQKPRILITQLFPLRPLDRISQHLPSQQPRLIAGLQPLRNRHTIISRTQLREFCHDPSAIEHRSINPIKHPQPPIPLHHQPRQPQLHLLHAVIRLNTLAFQHPLIQPQQPPRLRLTHLQNPSPNRLQMHRIILPLPILRNSLPHNPRNPLTPIHPGSVPPNLGVRGPLRHQRTQLLRQKRLSPGPSQDFPHSIPSLTQSQLQRFRLR